MRPFELQGITIPKPSPRTNWDRTFGPESVAVPSIHERKRCFWGRFPNFFSPKGACRVSPAQRAGKSETILRSEGSRQSG